MEPSQEIVNQAIVAVGCGAAIYAYFGKQGLPAAILAFMFAWRHQQFALGISGGVLVLFVILNVINRKTEPVVKKHDDDSDIIDAEFEIVKPETEQWKTSE